MINGSPKVRIEENAEVNDSILLGDVRVGKGVTLNKAIIDKRVNIPDGLSVGVDPEEDLHHGFTISDGGIVVVPMTEGFEEVLLHS